MNNRIASPIEKFAHIIGIGNLTRKDDGIAIRIIHELEKKNLPANIKITDLGTGGIDVILALDGWKIGIIIDAVDLPHLNPGEIEVYQISEEKIPEIRGFSSTHGFDVFVALKLAYELREYKLPENLYIIGIQIKDLEGIGLTISTEVKRAIPKVMEKVKEILNDQHY